MLSKETCKKITTMIQDEAVAQEVFARLNQLQTTPKSIDEIRSILTWLNPGLNEKIANVFKIKMANYDHGECGIEIANGLNGVLLVLQAAIEGKDLQNLKKNLDGDMDRVSFEALSIAIASIDCARNFEVVYNKMINSVCAIEILAEPQKVEIAQEIPLEIMVNAKQDRVHTEKRSERKAVVKRIHFR